MQGTWHIKTALLVVLGRQKYFLSSSISHNMRSRFFSCFL